MKKITFLLFALALAGCKNEKAELPAYLHIPAMKKITDFSSEGTASSNFTCAWVEVDGLLSGVFELPATIPVLAMGEVTVRVYPGINMNGSTHFRYQYDQMTPYEETVNFEPLKDYWLNTAKDSIPYTRYRSGTTIVRLEDFEQLGGTNLQTTTDSDTALLVTIDTTELFPSWKFGEPNQRGGKAVLANANFLFEVETGMAYNLPVAGRDIFIELDYKSTVPFTVGVFANTFIGRIQAPVVRVNPRPFWNKIYINLVSEVSGYPNALDFNIFIGSINVAGQGEQTILFDNLKLVY